MTDDEYRHMARDAERKARSAKNEADRKVWLRLAQTWMNLDSGRAQSDAENSDQTKSDS